MLPRCWFDAEKCEVGIEALTFYRKTYNEKMQEFTGTPVRDWSSHGADAFRWLAVRHKPPQVERPKRRDFQPRRSAPRPTGGKRGWMR